MPGEALVLGVDDGRVDRGAVRRRGGVVGREHPGDAPEVLEGAGLALLPRPLLHVGEALRPEPARVGRRHDEHVDPGPRAGEAVRQPSRAPGPVDAGLGSRLVREPLGRPGPLGGVGEHLAEGLVGVRALPGGLRRHAALHPERLHRELAAPPLARDQRPHVGSRVGALARTPGRREHPVHLGGAHRGDVVERQAALADRLGARRDVALARVRGGGDPGPGDPSLRQRREDLPSLGHGHRPLSVSRRPPFGRPPHGFWERYHASRFPVPPVLTAGTKNR